MSTTSTAALGVSRFLVWLFIVGNFLAGALMTVGFVASFIFERQLLEVMRTQMQGVDTALLLPVIRIWLLLALPAVGAITILLRRTLDLLRSVQLGQAFAPENAARLRVMAWCLLAVQVIHLAGGVMARLATHAMHRAIDWDLNLVGWLATFLLFVLAQVFDAGARMRSELDEMI